MQDSDLGKAMRESERGSFTFAFTVEDNDRIYSASVDVETELTDSAGGDLKKSEPA